MAPQVASKAAAPFVLSDGDQIEVTFHNGGPKAIFTVHISGGRSWLTRGGTKTLSLRFNEDESVMVGKASMMLTVLIKHYCFAG